MRTKLVFLWKLILVCLTQIGCSESKYIAGVSRVIEEDIYLITDKQIEIQKLYATAPYTTWPNNQIPFSVNNNIRNDADTYGKVETAIQTIHENTNNCVRFVPRGADDVDYINITRDGPGCYSSVGKIGGEQTVNIGEGCEYVGVIMHELLHALGFWHEQSRSDRDGYVLINYQNIILGRDVEFSKRSGQEDLEDAVPYDFHSILHYKYNQFAKLQSLDTIIPNQHHSNVDKTVLGQRQELSGKDIDRIKWLYNCGQNAISTCKAPSLTYGSITPNAGQYTTDSVVEFSCTTGFLIGPKNSTCQLDGTWSGATPFCMQARAEHFVYCDMENECFKSWYSPKAKWQLHKGATTTQGTGLSLDHTYQTLTGSYMLMEAAGVPANRYAVVYANRVQKRSGEDMCILFYYYMYGSNMGSLSVYATGSWRAFIYISGAGNNAWTCYKSNLPKTWSSYVWVTFRATVGSGAASDIAVDDVLIGPCSEVNRYNTIITSSATTP